MLEEKKKNKIVSVEVEICLKEAEWNLVKELKIKPYLAAFHSYHALKSIYNQSPYE